jgi:hypothetical protein
MTWRGQGGGHADAAFPTPPVVPDRARHAGQGSAIEERSAERVARRQEWVGRRGRISAHDG